MPLIYREFPTLNHGFFSYITISSVCEAAAERICAYLHAVLAG